jgi:5-formyltetrahydrofolate cyclo-ligase
VAFDTQEIEAIPMQPQDVALDYVLTETRTIDFRSI